MKGVVFVFLRKIRKFRRKSVSRIGVSYYFLL